MHDGSIGAGRGNRGETHIPPERLPASTGIQVRLRVEFRELSLRRFMAQPGEKFTHRCPVSFLRFPRSVDLHRILAGLGQETRVFPFDHPGSGSSQAFGNPARRAVRIAQHAFACFPQPVQGILKFGDRANLHGRSQVRNQSIGHLVRFQKQRRRGVPVQQSKTKG